MSYAAVLVHAEPSPECEPRLRLAANVANAFDALLIGVGAEVIYPITVGAFGEAVVVAGKEALRADLMAAEASFRAAARDVRKGVEWRVQENFPEEMIASQARAADLIVAGPQKGIGVGLYGAASPGELLMQCGRPILVAPTHTTELDASSIVIGWRDTRESRRAISDALPFLKKARQVLIVEICESDSAQPGAHARVTDVANALARHGIKASTAVRPRPLGDIAEDLMHVAEVHEAGLVVCGGYGHSRLREWIFGGVTREFLYNPARPVLLSR